METWRHEDIDMKTRKHGEMETSKRKMGKKPRRFSLIHLQFAHRANVSLSFVFVDE